MGIQVETTPSWIIFEWLVSNTVKQNVQQLLTSHPNANPPPTPNLTRAIVKRVGSGITLHYDQQSSSSYTDQFMHATGDNNWKISLCEVCLAFLLWLQIRCSLPAHTYLSSEDKNEVRKNNRYSFIVHCLIGFVKFCQGIYFGRNKSWVLRKY